MRRIVKAATVSAIAAGLLSLSASSALAGGYEFDKEKAATHVAQCVLSETTISSGLLPDDPIGTDPIPDPATRSRPPRALSPSPPSS